MRSITFTLFITYFIMIALFLFFNNFEVYLIEVLNNANHNKLIYSLLSFLVLLSDIVFPVPNSFIMYMNGVVLGSILGGILTLCSSMVSSVLGYLLGQYIGNGKINITGIYGKDKDINDDSQIIEGEKFMLKYGLLAIVISRCIPVLSETVCVISGYKKVSMRRYLILNLVGYIPVSFVYSVFGSIGNNKDLFLISFSIILIFSAIVWYLGKFLLNVFK